MGWLSGSSVQNCGGCGRGIPAGRRACPHCSNAGRTRSTSSKGKAKGKPRRCGRADGSFSGCGGFVPAGGRCDRCHH